MCLSFNKTNRIRLIVGSSEISEEAELTLTTRINEVILTHQDYYPLLKNYLEVQLFFRPKLAPFQRKLLLCILSSFGIFNLTAYILGHRRDFLVKKPIEL